MAASIELLTTGNMYKASVTNSPDEDAEHPVENIFDDNPNTYWTMADWTSNVSVYVDLGEQPTAIGGLAVYLRNYEQITTPRSLGGLYYSLDGIDYPTYITGSLSLIDTTGPLRLWNFPTSGTAFPFNFRYWKFVISGASGNSPEISMIYFYKRFVPSVGSRIPEEDEDIALVAVDEFPGGQIQARATSFRMQRQFSREFLLTDTTDRDRIRDAYEDSYGPLYPLILREGDTQADWHLVNFTDTSLPHVQRSLAGGYSITLNFRTVPVIPWESRV